MKQRTVIWLVVLGLAVLTAVWVRQGRDARRLVVYCAHDSVYAESVLKDFEKRTGIRVTPRFDSEATKSLGLIELLIREKSAPRCDVFWNNELLGMLDLKERGVLQPYKGPGYARIPEAFKDPDGHWTGFAARMRVMIVNTNLCPATEAVLGERLKGDLSQAAIAKPIYGTTLTHYSVLWQRLGEQGLKAWHADTRRRGLREVRGNGTVKDIVANGACAFGFTDTDDYFLAQDAGKPVAMLPVRLADRSTISIPNTVAIIAGSPRFEDACILVDYLLSEESEIALANARSRQIPLGPVDEARVPDEVKTLRKWARDAVSLASLSEARAACLAWLRSGE